MQKDSDRSWLLKKCKYRPIISCQNSFSKRSTHQSITCWFWYLLFLFLLFVDLFKPLLQKTFVERIVENPLRDQPRSLFSPWLKARRGKGSGHKEISSHHDASAKIDPKPYNLHLTFPPLVHSEVQIWKGRLKKSTIKPLRPPWLHTKFDSIEKRLAQGDTSLLATDSGCLNREQV